MGINVQVCWEKFANYWDVEMRLVPMEGDRFNLSADEAVEALRREHHRRRRDPRLDLRRLVRAGGGDLRGARRPPGATGIDVPVHVDGASGAFVAPFLDPDLEWDFRLPRVASINTSGHKYGLVYPGVGWVVWRDAAALPEDLIFWVNYLGDNMPTFALNFSRPGAQVIAQYYNFLRLGFEGYAKVQGYAREVATRLSARSRRSGRSADHARRRAAGVRLHAQATRSRTTPSSTSPTPCASAAGRCPPTRSRRTGTDLAALRVVVGGLHPRPGRPADRGHQAAPAAPPEPAGAGARRLGRPASTTDRGPRLADPYVVDRRAVHGRLAVLCRGGRPGVRLTGRRSGGRRDLLRGLDLLHQRGNPAVPR